MSPEVDKRETLEGPFRLSNWLVEPRLNRLTRGEESIQIELKMMDVLVCLAEHSGELVERQTLIDTVWATEYVAENILTRAIAEIRNALGDDSRNPTFIETIHRRGYRLLQEPVPCEDASGTIAPRPAARRRVKDPAAKPRARRRWFRVTLVALPIAALAVVLGLWLLRGRTVLDEADTILLTDFVNHTGDPIFDLILRHALAVKLEESPFLHVESEERVLEALRRMERDLDEAITPLLGREICQRLNLKAMITGEIAPLGTRYVVTLNAVECGTGDSLAREQAEAAAKEELLAAMDRATAVLRRKLGESLRSIEDFDTPLAMATTPSLEALKSRTIAVKLSHRGLRREARSHNLRAIELDPTFAGAYSGLAVSSRNSGDWQEARKWITEAFAHRDHATERSRLLIEAFYYKYATGEYQKAIDTWRVRHDLYAGRRPIGLTNMGNLYHALGRLERALELHEEYFRKMPDSVRGHSNLVWDYLALGRLEEAERVLAAGLAMEPDFTFLRMFQYRIAFVRRDRKTTEEVLQWSSGRPYEGHILREHALAAASGGRFRECRELAEQSRNVAERFDTWAVCSRTLAAVALAEAKAGLVERAVQDAEAALTIRRSPGADAARAFALAGETERAQLHADELEQSWPLHTLVNSVHVPSIRAEIALAAGNPEATIELLLSNLPFENVYRESIDIRGRALLATGSAAEAAAEFERLLENLGEMPNHPRYATAHLWLGRARAAAEETDTAIKSYETFLELWKEADPDIPLLLEARAEYEQLTTAPR